MKLLLNIIYSRVGLFVVLSFVFLLILVSRFISLDNIWSYAVSLSLGALMLYISSLGVEHFFKKKFRSKYKLVGLVLITLFAIWYAISLFSQLKIFYDCVNTANKGFGGFNCGDWIFHANPAMLIPFTLPFGILIYLTYPSVFYQTSIYTLDIFVVYFFLLGIWAIFEKPKN